MILLRCISYIVSFNNNNSIANCIHYITKKSNQPEDDS